MSNAKSLMRQCIMCKDFFGCKTIAPSKEFATKLNDGCDSKTINAECRDCSHGKHDENICNVDDSRDDNFTAGICKECAEKHKTSRENKKVSRGVVQT